MYQASITYFLKEINTEDYQHYNLLMYVGVKVLSYVIINNENEILVFEKYTLNLTDKDLMIQFFEEKKWLLSKYATIKIAFGTNQTSTVPSKFYDTNKIADNLDTQYGDILKYKSFANENKLQQLHTLYRIENDVYDTFQMHFPNTKKTHFQSIALQNKYEDNTTSIQLYFLEDTYLLHIVTNNKLVFAKTYSMQSNEELIYNLLAACKLNQIELNDTTVTISGWLSKESALFKELYKFISNLKMEDKTVLHLNNETLERHFFYPFQLIHQYN
jgi:Protein of unknown function (DUF3822)